MVDGGISNDPIESASLGASNVSNDNSENARERSPRGTLGGLGGSSSRRLISPPPNRLAGSRSHHDDEAPLDSGAIVPTGDIALAAPSTPTRPPGLACLGSNEAATDCVDNADIRMRRRRDIQPDDFGDDGGDDDDDGNDVFHGNLSRIFGGKVQPHVISDLSK